MAQTTTNAEAIELHRLHNALPVAIDRATQAFYDEDGMRFMRENAEVKAIRQRISELVGS